MIPPAKHCKASSRVLGLQRSVNLTYRLAQIPLQNPLGRSVDISLQCLLGPRLHLLHEAMVEHVPPSALLLLIGIGIGGGIRLSGGGGSGGGRGRGHSCFGLQAMAQEACQGRGCARQETHLERDVLSVADTPSINARRGGGGRMEIRMIRTQQRVDSIVIHRVIPLQRPP